MLSKKTITGSYINSIDIARTKVITIAEAIQETSDTNVNLSSILNSRTESVTPERISNHKNIQRTLEKLNEDKENRKKTHCIAAYTIYTTGDTMKPQVMGILGILNTGNQKKCKKINKRVTKKIEKAKQFIINKEYNPIKRANWAIVISIIAIVVSVLLNIALRIFDAWRSP